MVNRTLQLLPPQECERPYTVSQITQAIAELIESGNTLVWFAGEVSNVKRHTSGHCYLRLKDSQSQIPAVIWSSTFDRLRFVPSDGDEVAGVATLKVYRRGGYYQLDIRRMQPSGLGALYAAFEALKRKLQQEGLFDESRKKPLPRTVRRLGVVTSKTGAAVRDIIRVVVSRCPRTDIVLHNVLVQGERAAADIAGAIDRFNRRGDVDLLIVGRGGGSIEDLWAFNEEVVARAMAASAIPIISAVGHETDFTIADFVADARAATPSAAAEMAVPDEEEQRRYFGSLVRRFTAGYFRLFRQRRSDFDHLLSALALRKPFRLAQEGRQSLDDARRRLYREMGDGLRQRGQTLAAQAGRLQALSPLGVLGRGYSIVSTEKGTVVKNSADLSVGQTIRVQFARGRAGASVRDTET